MKVIFDFEESSAPSHISSIYAGPYGEALIQMKELVTQRLLVLQQDIEWQGVETVINIMAERLTISYRNATQSLGEKMRSCISQRDIDYIATKIAGVLPPDEL